ncbi:helix-turn-helix transcriptional regulator [Chamaesiphon sp. OTE_20_metabat_361]|uniref:helix-turn-helix transcriptional regulator n=1 Tax=Chamaesiphon sp. OTE_20_metabat_361 TaxID=2964689 RepID=UPI00286BD207|nr:helix-turn-helix transcriptional regulator [Chamaesiphon sp. OTE_20_metabat_361]
MSKDRKLDRTLQLQALMQQVGIMSFKQLYQATGTSDRTIRKLRSGEIGTIRWQTLVKIASILRISVTEAIATFDGQSNSTADRQELATLQQEYQHLQQQFNQQRATLEAEFQFQSLQTIESFLTYFPAAKAAAMNNPDFPASKIFPLLKSIDLLIQQWNVTVIGEIGEQISYEPRWHQLIEGMANPDELVTVRYVGYRQSDKLIFRAKVSI